MSKSLVCFYCSQSTGQLPQEYSIIFCTHCEKTYVEDDEEDDSRDDNIESSSPLHKDNEYFPSEGSDEEVDEMSEASDSKENQEEEASDYDSDEFVLLPPRDDVYVPSDESDNGQDRQTERRNAFGELDDLDTPAKSTAASTSKSKAKPKEKKPAKPKRATAKTTKRNPKATPRKASTKLPSIFSEALLPDATLQKNDTSNMDELAFSDFSDEEGINDSNYTPVGKQNKARKKRRARKHADMSDSDTDDDEEEEDEIITNVKRKSEDSQAPKKYTRNNLRAATPLKQYSTFAQFNKEMRGKLAKEHREALELSGEPQKQLSQLVGDAWKALSQAEKDKFKQKLKGEKEDLKSVARKKPIRPSGNGYILYSKIKLPQVKAEHPEIKSIRDQSAIVGQSWKALTDDEREVYKAKAKQERDDWIKKHPEQHQQYMDKMTNKIRATKRARRD